MWYINLRMERPLGHEAERFGRPYSCFVPYAFDTKSTLPVSARILVIGDFSELSLLDTQQLFVKAAAMDQLSAVIGEMIKQYPDPHGARPIANYPATMYGITITFHVGCSASVRSRM